MMSGRLEQKKTTKKNLEHKHFLTWYVMKTCESLKAKHCSNEQEEKSV
jgi:hypothetical protein